MDVDDDAGGLSPGGLPPWIDPGIQQRIAWRDGDIVVSVPPKSGTTWTMNIVHQLRTGGDPDFGDIYVEVPWIELVPRPGADVDAIVAGIDAMPTHRRRAFKTHAGAGELPFHAAGSGTDVRYVVVVRNPDEAVASFWPFINAHSDAWFEMWGAPKEAVVGADFDAYFAELGSHGIVPMVFGSVAAWWPLRHEANVAMVHYADMVREPESTIRRIADVLGFAPGDDEWPAILEYTSFGWMKAHEDRFELRQVTREVPLLDPGAMIRKGRVGASGEDGITPQVSARIAELGRSILDDERAFEWCYRGGPLP